MFPVTSRYYGIEIATLEINEEHTVKYLHRRFLPDSTKTVVLTEHAVAQGERLDNVTARYLGDPEQFWLICDANNAMRPGDLVAEDQVGHSLRIPLPQGG